MIPLRLKHVCFLGIAFVALHGFHLYWESLTLSLYSTESNVSFQHARETGICMHFKIFTYWLV